MSRESQKSLKAVSIKLFTFISMQNFVSIFNPNDYRLLLKNIQISWVFIYPIEDGLSSAKRTTEALFRKDVDVLSRLSDSEIDDVFEGAPKCNLIFNPNEITVLDLAIKANCFQSKRMSNLFNFLNIDSVITYYFLLYWD